MGLLNATVGAVNTGSSLARGVVVSGSSKVMESKVISGVSGVGLGVISGVQTGVTSGISKVRQAAIGPDEETLKEIEK